MEKITIEKARAISERKGLRPARIIGTTGVMLTKGDPRMSPITWEEFEAVLSERGLAVYEQGGWMKIMRARPPVAPSRRPFHRSDDVVRPV